ncbi:integrase-like protein [Raoultella sp. BIGb0138]|nr:integrase-like protein [Raoultella sp. BIGb0138]
MDFVADNLFNGRRIRALTIVDNSNRECLAIQIGQGLRGEDVVTVMERLKQMKRCVPLRLQTDNGSEFISKSLEQ